MPCDQIFIDEIDSLLRNRGQDNHEVTSTIKAEFLTSVSLRPLNLPSSIFYDQLTLPNLLFCAQTLGWSHIWREVSDPRSRSDEPAKRVRLPDSVDAPSLLSC